MKDPSPIDLFVTPMEEVRILSRSTRNSEQLLNLSQRYCNDFETCKCLITNRYLTEDCKAVLVLSQDVRVRRMLAENGERIQSTKTQLRLVLDNDKTVRENLARTTTKEEIKEILFKSNPESKNNAKIRAYCLKRMRNMEIMEKFILSSSAEILGKYADNILSNMHLTYEILNLFVVIFKSNLSEYQKGMVMDHPSFDPVHINLN